MIEIRKVARELKQQTMVVYFAARDPRTPWLVRLLALAIAAYALSPIDLIPDFIPILGYLDDLIIVPLGIALVLRLVPQEVRSSAQQKASAAAKQPVSFFMATVIVAIWLALLATLSLWVWQAMRA